MKRTILTASLLIGVLSCATALALDSSQLEQRRAGLEMKSSVSSMMYTGSAPMAAEGANYWEQRSTRLHQVAGEKTYTQQGELQGVRESSPWWR